MTDPSDNEFWQQIHGLSPEETALYHRNQQAYHRDKYYDNLRDFPELAAQHKQEMYFHLGKAALLERKINGVE